MAEREWQHRETAIFWQAVNLWRFPTSAAPRKTAWRTWQLPMEYLYYINNSPFRSALFTGQNLIFIYNRFHQVWEMKSNRLLFLLNTLPPTRFPDPKMKTLASGSRILTSEEQQSTLLQAMPAALKTVKHLLADPKSRR